MQITSLYVYPVKSCKGIALSTAVLTATGATRINPSPLSLSLSLSLSLTHTRLTADHTSGPGPAGFLCDRGWMVVAAGTGKFITQRQQPTMALIGVSVTPMSILEGTSSLDAFPDAALVLTAPGHPPLSIPLRPSSSQPLVPVQVWDWAGLAADEGEGAAGWLSSYLNMQVRLVRYAGVWPSPQAPFKQRTTPTASPNSPLRRQVDPKVAGGDDYVTAFSDGFPVLLASVSSLQQLNSELPASTSPLLPDRFRANIWVCGAAPWEEDSWARVRMRPARGVDAANTSNDQISGSGDASSAGIEFELVKPCSRCKITTIDQETGEEGMEPLPTLQRMRSGKVLGWGEQQPTWRGRVFFAWNMVSDDTGLVCVGDRVEVVRKRATSMGSRVAPA
jgi:uncharacterized protein YcbX